MKINRKKKIFKEIKSGFKKNEKWLDIEIKKANAFIKDGNFKKAEIIFKKLIASDIKNPIVFGNLAAIYGLKGEKSKMINLLENAIELKPNFPDALNNLGVAYIDIDEIDKAIESLNKAIRLKSNFHSAHLNLGMALAQKGELKQAIVSYKNALKLKVNYLDAFINLGLAQLRDGNSDDAISSFEQAIKLDFRNAKAHSVLGKTLLFIGNYERGWTESEYRLQKNSTILHGIPKIPLWDGGELQKEEHLLVVTEQGLGDTIQFMRYIKVLKSMKINVSFCAQDKLHELIKISKIHPNPLSPADCNSVGVGKWVPLLTLPKYLRVSPKNPIIKNPYIKTTDYLLKKWRKIFSSENKPIIGINWQGNKKIEKSDILRGRSIQLEFYSQIASDNFKFLSLQKGFGSEQLEKCSFIEHFVNFQNDVSSIWGFVENTAIIQNCSLIITTDTSIAHLAGGLGKETWLLLQNVPEWRWGDKGDQTFWYPNMKLFRQNERDNWNEVMYRVSNELTKFLKQNKYEKE